jgi:hypothetical protein
MWPDFPDLGHIRPAQGTLYSILPLQTGCPHLQSMSGIFSIDSHCTLQYFPAIAVHEQFGCAHFFVFSIAISLSLDQSVLASLRSESLPQRGSFESSNFPKIKELQIRVCSILRSVDHASATEHQSLDRYPCRKWVLELDIRTGGFTEEIRKSNRRPDAGSGLPLFSNEQ